MECYAGIKKKKGNLAIWDLEGIRLSGRSQTKKDKYCKHWIISLKCGIFKKKKDTKNRLVVARDAGFGMGEMGEGGQKIHISS